jgi:energy-coupling factor transport system substrate-specific component
MHRTRRALLACLLAAVAAALGLALSGVPNVELVTLVVFLSGFLLGPAYGALIGAVSAVTLSLFNPLGAALPPLVGAQAAGQAFAGLSGGLAGPAVTRLGIGAGRLVSGGIGLVVTIVYDALTSAGAYATIAGERTIEGLVKFVAAGILFVGVHIAWNTALFAVVLPSILRILGRHRKELNTE